MAFSSIPNSDDKFGILPTLHEFWTNEVKKGKEGGMTLYVSFVVALLFVIV
jgi:hypothetical protein